MLRVVVVFLLLSLSVSAVAYAFAKAADSGRRAAEAFRRTPRLPAAALVLGLALLCAGATVGLIGSRHTTQGIAKVAPHEDLRADAPYVTGGGR